MKRIIILTLCLLMTVAVSAQQKEYFEKEKDAITETALNYLEGWFTGDAERMDKALHPGLNKVRPNKLPQTGKTLLQHSSSELLIEATHAKMGVLEEDKWDIEFILHDMLEPIALVEVLSSQFVDYLQIGKFNGEWKIVNVLWQVQPKENKVQSKK